MSIGTARLKKVLKEEAMEHVAETSPVLPGHPMSDGTWVQITFTLDPEHYQILWERAEEEHRTLSCLAREAVIDYLMKAQVHGNEA